MINIKIEDNLAALRGFEDAANSRVSFQEASHIATIQGGEALSAVRLPEWSRRYWESLTASLPLALDENEIGAVHRFYILDELARLKGTNHDPCSYWREQVDSVLRELVKNGNPLKHKTD